MIPYAAILASFDEGLSYRAAATRHRLTVALCRALWEAHALGGDPQAVPVCPQCTGSGVKDGEWCEACRTTGMRR